MYPMDAGLVLSTSEQGVEVLAKPQRRKYSQEYKLRILREADKCTRPGQLGSLLRREGLYSSTLSNWRRARARGGARTEAAVAAPGLTASPARPRTL
jgi:transposase-like protein